MHKEHFAVTGMTCSACSSRVQKAVGALEGVTDATVNLLKNSLSVTFDEAALSSEDIVLAVEHAGYGAVPRGVEPSARQAATDGATQELHALKRRLAISFAFTVPLFYISMGHMVGLPLPEALTGPGNALAFALTQFLLMLPVVVVNGAYYRVGFKTLFSGAPNMDSLIAIGSGAAVVSGVYALYAMAFALGRGDMAAVHHRAMNLYFESGAMILALITLGKFFEARAKGKTSEAIARLMDLAPETATVMRDGVATVVPSEAVVVGDILAVKAGERVPVDGVITEGNGFLDESAITGESLPREKGSGEGVTGATINTAGHFYMRATRVGEDTALARIIALVDEATSSKAPIARLADTISGVFVPMVILIAVGSTITWLLLGYGLDFALSIGISVLVISCPCALGLATPTAIMVGTGRGAARGILFKSAEAIETTQAISAVVLDKTGTITEGKPVVTDILPVGPGGEEELLSVAASLEALSEHPLGAAIVKEAATRAASLRNVENFIQIPGQGIAGTIDGIRCVGGNALLLRAEGITSGSDIVASGEALAAEGKTTLYFTRGGAMLGAVAVADAIRKTSAEAVAQLENMGIAVVMVTGDTAVTAEAIRKQAGIGRVMAGVLPEDKEQEIRALQSQGKVVAMIGDGINDAPALARADVGIAIGAGTDIAMESADVVLIQSDLLDAVSAIRLSRAVMRTIRQNLFWAFFYNIVGIPVAAGVFYGLWGLTLNPMIAAAAMSFSSVTVVANALRLRRFTPEGKSWAAPGATCENTAQQCQRSTEMKKILQVAGMNCGHCSSSVEKALRAVPGVTEALVDLSAKTATITTNSPVSEDVLKAAITNAGFEVTGIR